MVLAIISASWSARHLSFEARIEPRIRDSVCEQRGTNRAHNYRRAGCAANNKSTNHDIVAHVDSAAGGNVGDPAGRRVQIVKLEQGDSSGCPFAAHNGAV